MHTKLQATVALIVLAVLAGCSGGERPATPTPAAPTTSTSAPSDAAVAATVSWAARTVTVTGVDGYQVSFCDGDGPMLCVTENGEHLGAIELIAYPATTPAMDLHAAEAWAANFVSSIGEDRKAGCHPDFTVTADDVTGASFAGTAGARYGFTGNINGRTVERVLGHVAVIDGTLYVLSLNALADDGCLSREAELPLAAADDLADVLAALAAGSQDLPDRDLPGPHGEPVPAADAPKPDPEPAGTVVRSGWLRGRSDEGFLDYDDARVLTGEAARVAAEAAGAEVPGDFFIEDPEPSISTLPVSDRLVVELYDCTAGCERHRVDAQAFLLHTVNPSGGPGALVELTVLDGVIIAVREIYLP